MDRLVRKIKSENPDRGSHHQQIYLEINLAKSKFVSMSSSMVCLCTPGPQLAYIHELWGIRKHHCIGEPRESIFDIAGIIFR